jgi:radical SAM protein with 4Fe4S-binding SPASM domain
VSKQDIDFEKFCVVPFTTIILEPNGDVGVCRQKGTEFIFGNIKDNTLEEIWNGEKLTSWRKEFISGEIDTCTKEMKHMRCHQCKENNQMLDALNFDNLLESKIIKLTANFNGQCNLQCQMCHIWKMPNGLYDEVNFWEYAKESLFKTIHEIDMLSGEPLIQKDTFRLINEVSDVNPECKWTITTNAHWKLNDHIQSHLDKIVLKNLIVSIDSLDKETYYKIRYPGKIDLVLQNLEELIRYKNERQSNGLQPFNIHWNFLAQKDNWREIPEVLKYTQDRGILPFVTFLYEPEEYSLLTLPPHEQKEIITYLIENTLHKDLPQIRRVILPLIESQSIADKKTYLMAMMA